MKEVYIILVCDGLSFEAWEHGMQDSISGIYLSEADAISELEEHGAKMVDTESDYHTDRYPQWIVPSNNHSTDDRIFRISKKPIDKWFKH